MLVRKQQACASNSYLDLTSSHKGEKRTNKCARRPVFSSKRPPLFKKGCNGRTEAVSGCMVTRAISWRTKAISLILAAGNGPSPLKINVTTDTILTTTHVDLLLMGFVFYLEWVERVKSRPKSTLNAYNLIERSIQRFRLLLKIRNFILRINYFYSFEKCEKNVFVRNTQTGLIHFHNHPF